MTDLDRRTVVQGSLAAAATLALPTSARAAAPDLAAVHAEAGKQAAQSLERLQAWVRQPSIFGANIGVTEGAAMFARMCTEAGFTKVEQIPTKGAPAIFATLDAGAKRTLGLYFMYDVKAVEEKEWSTPPFAGSLVDVPEAGKVLMARGAVNQKGPESAFLSALHAIKSAGKKLPVNLVLVAEGEEEDGSIHLPDVVRRKDVQAAYARCQGVMMPSASQDLDGTTEIAFGSKGVLEVELECTGEKWGRGPRDRDIHSGNKPAVDSPVWHLVQALATLVTPDGNDPAIDGLEALVRPFDAAEKAMVADSAKRSNQATFMKELHISKWARDATFEQAIERLAGRPTVNIQGITAGYQGPLGKTILPWRALAKLDLRMVPDMTGEKVLALLEAHLAKRGFGDIEVRTLATYDPTTAARDSLPVRAALAAYKAMGKDPIQLPRTGGSWPGYLWTQKPLSVPAIHFGLGYGQGAHSKDEYFLVEPKGSRAEGLTGAVKSYLEFLYAFATV